MSCLLPHFNCHLDTFSITTINRSAAAATKTIHFRPQCILSPSTSSTPLLIFYNNNNKFHAWPCVAAQPNFRAAESLLTSEEEAVVTIAASQALALAKAAAKLAKAATLLVTNKPPQQPRPAGKAATNVLSFKFGSTGKVDVDSSDPQCYLRSTTTATMLLTPSEQVKLSEGIQFYMVGAAYKVKEARKQLYRENGRQPDDEEVAEAAGMSMKRLSAVLLTPKAPKSLETKIGINQSLKPSEVLADPEAQTAKEKLVKQIMKMDMEKVLDCLNLREKQVIRWRFGVDDGRMKSLREIGEMMGVSKERIRQIEACAFRKLANEKSVEHLQ
ncbi:hypothetical protein TSUD_310750 [Trifolium subterraneum]|nr:hypothetical protein TSUD_310750 [Trifolium subterraneum]